MRNKKRRLCLLLCLLMAAGLCSCARASDNAPDSAEQETGAVAPSGALKLSDPEPVTDTVPGWYPTLLPQPDWLLDAGGWLCRGDTIWRKGKSPDGNLLLAAYDTLNGTWERYDIYPGEGRNLRIDRFSISGDSYWLLMQESYSDEDIENLNIYWKRGYYLMYGRFSTGETRYSPIAFEGASSSESSEIRFNGLIALDDGRALLCSEGPCRIIDPEANIIAEADFQIYGGGSGFEVNGLLYMYTPDGYAPLDTVDLRYGEPVAADGDLCCIDSSAGHFFRTHNSILYRYDPRTEESEEVFSWIDVALSYDSMGGFTGLENSAGDFFYLYSGRSGGCIVKVTRGNIPAKRTLTLACFGNAGSDYYSWANTVTDYTCSRELMDAIIRFNNTDPEYKVEIRPFVFNGDADRDRLLIEIATGSGVDLIDTSLLPESAMNSGVLVDMLPYMDADPEISRSDFIQPLFNAMLKDGSLYEYTEKFTVVSMITHPDLFTGRNDWTTDNIIRLRAQHPEYGIITRSQAFETIVRASTAEFIDWDEHTCSYDSSAFIGWLEFLNSLPEESTGAVPLASILYDAACSAGGGSRFILEDEYVYSGFPNAVGSGSYFLRLDTDPTGGEESIGRTGGDNTRIAMMASGSNKYGAWRFVRTLMLGEDDPNLFSGIPVFRDSFERALANETGDEKIRKRFSALGETDSFNAEDAQKLRDLVYSTTKLIRPDETILTVIRSEINAYLGGGKTAEDAAKQIQSRVGLYLAEQS